MTRTLALLAALLLGGAAQAHETVAGDLQIIHPHIPRPAATAMVAGGYMAITNSGTTPDRLIGVSADFAKSSMIHESKVDSNGMATMSHIDALEIPPGETVVLERGGYHVMFMGLTAPLDEGAMLPATLVFEKAGEVQVEFSVDPPGATVDHSQHQTTATD